MCAAQQRYMTTEKKWLALTWFEEDGEDATEIVDRSCCDAVIDVCSYEKPFGAPACEA